MLSRWSKYGVARSGHYLFISMYSVTQGLCACEKYHWAMAVESSGRFTKLSTGGGAF